MAPDAELQKDILAELAAEPILRGRNLSVAVERGIVTMRGNVCSHDEKVVADQVAHRVGGRRSLALGVSIRQQPSSDDDWVREVRGSLEQ